MIRLSNMADYALVLLTYVAGSKTAGPAGVMTARSLASASGLPEPTVSKVLKQLAKAALLISRRGAGGGYALARPADTISVAEVLQAVEGPVALTRCTRHHPVAPHKGSSLRQPPARSDSCALWSTCPTRDAWGPVNEAVTAALAGLTLRDVSQRGRIF